MRRRILHILERGTLQPLGTLTGNRDTLHEAGQAAGKYISEHLGATDLIYNDIFGQKQSR